MNYIFLDFEFNQYFSFSRGEISILNESCPFEIMQIGAVKTTEKLEMIGEFKAFVKPVLYKRIHPYVENLTGIKASMLENAEVFPSVYKSFRDFTGDEHLNFVWGTDDIPTLYKNVKYHNLDTVDALRPYVNVQKCAAQQINNTSNSSVSLKNAVQAVNISYDKDFHDALNDAFYTYKVYAALESPNITLSQYTPSSAVPKESYPTDNFTYDSKTVIKYIENKISRRLNKREKSIAKLGYELGLRKQK